MYCAACNLHYPDHLRFCRRCGQPLVRSTGEAPLESTCCTRCGARVVRGEKFCQQCGFRFGAAVQETVIGACYHCGTSWRTGWLFCKNCGLDRDRALLLSTSTPFASSAPAKRSAPLEELPEVSKVRCKHCGAEAKPYSRFCEACGRGLNKIDNTAPSPAAPTPSAPTSTEAPAPQQEFAELNQQARSSRPTLVDTPVVPPPSAKASEAPKDKTKDQKDSGPLPSATVVTPDETAPADERRQTVVIKDEPSASGRLPANYTPADNLPISQRMATPINLGPSAASSVAAPVRQQRRALRKTVTLATLAAGLLGGIAAWWFWHNAAPEAVNSSTAPLPQTSPVPSSTRVTEATSSLAPTPVATAVTTEMILITGGQFMMGRNDGDEYERPAHPVTVRSFYLDRTEVTNEQYQKFIATTRYRAPAHWQEGRFPAGEARLPVVNVTWNDANAYAKWAKKRLPTEAEWEFAARGADGRSYPWGNEWREGWANVARGSAGKITEVGHYPEGATPLGLLDMCGNVWEWTASGLVSYADNKKVIASGKVIRGGAFDVPRERATTTYRGVLPAEAARDKTGFRCARDAQ